MQQQKNMKQIIKLEKQIADFQRQLTIEAKEKDIIKNYKMGQGDYQILISIYEASDLMPRGTNFWLFKTNKTACDAFVEIQVRDQVQRSSVRKDTNNPIFDEKFYFKFKGLTLEDLDRSAISFKLYDKKRFILSDSLIGCFQVDWTNVYFKRNHQIYRGWLTLMDPFDEQEGIMGYLMVSIAVLGQNDKITVHDSAFIKDPLTTIQDTVTMPKLQLIDYGINIEVYRAENLVPLDQTSGNVDAYVIAKFSGNKMDTSVKTSCNPQWDELIRLGTAVPTKSKYITLEVRNRNYMFGDDIIGVIKIPFIDLQQQSQPRWGHLYGPPVNGKDIQPYNYATKMQVFGQDIGSHYRGRLLYKITGKKDIINKNSRSKISFKFPFRPTPVVPLKSYTLRLEILDGFNIPDISQKNECYIHCCIGQYMLISKSFGKIKNKASSFMQKLPDKKIQFPQDYTQIPDLIIYYAKGERQKDRISYIRIPSKNLVTGSISNSMSIYSLKGDLTLNNFTKDQSGGFITARAHIFSGQPPQSKTSLLYQFGQKTKFLMKIFLYRAKGLPPMNDSGDCDPKILFHFAGAQSRLVPDETNRTYNPIWNKVIDIDIETEDFMNVDIQKALICNVFDEQQNGKDNFIGNFMVKLSKKNKRKYQGLNNKIQFLYQKPKWHPIINQKVDIGDPCFGHVLIGCAVFRKKDLHQFRHQDIKMIDENVDKKYFQMFLLGARKLQLTSNHLQNKSIFFQIKVGKNQIKISKDGDIKLNSANIGEMIPFQVDVPKNKSIIPYIDIKVFERKGQQKRFIGFSSISLYDFVPKIMNNFESKKENQQQQSEDTVVDLDELGMQLNIVRQRKRQRQQLMSNNLKKQKQNQDIQKMTVPKQLLTTTADQSQKNAKLDDLLNKFQEQYKQDPQYNYSQIVQKSNDRKLDEKAQFFGNMKMNEKQNFDKINSQLDIQQDRLLTSKQADKEDQMSGNPLFGLHKLRNQNKERKETTRMNLENPKSTKSRFSLANTQKQLFKKFTHKRYDKVNSEVGIKQDYNDAKNRFEFDSQQMKKSQLRQIKQMQEQEDKTVKNFDMDANQQIQQVQHDQRAIKYKDIQRIIQQQQKFTKQAMERQQNYKYAAAVKLSLFKWKKQKKDQSKQTYQDYDSDPEQVLDIIPEWYKGRKILATDFEQLVPNKKIRSLPIYQGGLRIANLDIRQKKQVGEIKCIGLVIQEQSRQQKQKQYLKLLRPKPYVCRIYILKGKSLISSLSKKPSTFLRISCRGEIYDLKDTTLRTQQYNPQYYICQQIPMEIPGSSNVKIQVMEYFSTVGISQSKVLGVTEIDIEQRLFTKKWHLFTEKKPIQLRNLYSQYGNGTQGRLEVWVDIIEKRNWLANPPFKIHPPPFDKFQLRVITWSTKDCVYKNQSFKSNDVFVRAYLGTSQAQETDTHWACRDVGNFNYRLKYDVSYPPKPEDMYSDQFVVQIWDRDVVGHNNLIGEKRINLNKIHRIIEKAVKRKKPVKAKMKIREKGLALTQKFWFDVYNHKAKDQFGQLQSQGKVQLSFELVPKQKAQKSLNNGFGRSQPNLFPTLPQPAGRLNFNILHPLDFCKQICGPDLYNNICYKLICFVIIFIILLLGYLIGGNLIALAIASKSNTSVTINNNSNNSTTN